MQRWSAVLRSMCLFGVGLLAVGVLYAWAQDTTVVGQFQNGIKVGVVSLWGLRGTSATGLTLGGSDVGSVAVTRGAVTTTFGPLGTHTAVPATEVIASAATITANACGSVKRISSASAVTTGTTDSLTDPVTTGVCVMWLCNVNASDSVTIDKNAKILLTGGANVELLASSCMAVGSDGVIWRQLSAQLAGT